ncbi:MFS transporter [Hyphomicrobium sp.]|uniref:MFS transporter n=1 Tax=Hyphomicrobium sp. TaxID=82 RepID=UPI002FE425EE
MPEDLQALVEPALLAGPMVYRQPLATVVSASAVSAAAALPFNVMPVLLTAAAGRFALDESQIGMLGSSYLAGIALAAATSSRWLTRFNWRVLVGCATLISVAALFACGIVSSHGMLMAGLAAAGAGLGVLYTLCISVVSESHRPDAAFGTKLTAEVFLGGAVLLFLSGFAIPRWGFPGAAFALAAIVGAVAITGLTAFPSSRAIIPVEEAWPLYGHGGRFRATKHDWPLWTGLAGLTLTFAGISALWAFLTELAPTLGVGDQAASSVFMAALVTSGISGIAAIAIGDRLGRLGPIAAGMLLAIAGAASLQWGHGFPAYLIGVVLAVGVWNFPIAFQMGLIASSDTRGQVTGLMPVALAIGTATGPISAGAMLNGAQSYAPLYALFAGAIAAGLAGFLVLGRWSAKRLP